MNKLHDRINQVINTQTLETCLEANGSDVIEFQCTWHKLSQGKFENLPKHFQEAIIAGEKELCASGQMDLAA